MATTEARLKAASGACSTTCRSRWRRCSTTGPSGWVGDVYTTPTRRGAGLGAAVVRTALVADAAGAELVFMPTEDRGRSTPLYERLGFRVAARGTRCSRQ